MVAKLQPHWDFTGQDVDHRAAQMTAINLGLNGLYGWAVWQNTLTLETHRVYKIGLGLHGGVIREVPVDQSPFDHAKQRPKPSKPTPVVISDPVDPSAPPPEQLDLF